MSFYASLDPSEGRNIAARAINTPEEPIDNDPGLFSGSLKAPLTGSMSAGVGLALLAGNALDSIADVGMVDAGIDLDQAQGSHAGKMIDSVFSSGSTVQDWMDERKRNFTRAAIELRPSPKTTGFVGQLLHGAFEVVPQYVAGNIWGGPVGGAMLVGSSMGNKKFTELRAEGVDYGTALGAGAIEGVTQGAGAVMPMHIGPAFTSGLGLAQKLAANAAFGGVANTAFGLASRTAFSGLLKGNGYDDLAAQYEPIEQASLTADFLLGSAFGILGSFPEALRLKRIEGAEKRIDEAIAQHKANLADVDAALAANETAHLEIDLAPGVPKDATARMAHIQAVDDATRALVADEPYSARPEHAEAEFITDPVREDMREEASSVIKEQGGLHDIDQDTGPFQEPETPRKVGPFGPVFTEHYHDAKGAIDRLLEAKDGEAVGALHHPDVGDIDLVWGKEGDARKEYAGGYGLAKISVKHPEVIGNLQGIVGMMQVVRKSNNRIMLESIDHKGIVRVEWNGERKTWLLTAYEKRDASAGKSMDTTGVSRGGDTALPPTGLGDESGAGKTPDTADVTGTGDTALRSTAPDESIKRQVEEFQRNKEAARSWIKFTNDDGTEVTATEALKQADDRIAEAHKEASLYDLAIECAMMG